MKALDKRLGIYFGVLLLTVFGRSSALAQHLDLTINPVSAVTGTVVVMAEVPVGPIIGLEFQSSYFFKARRPWTPNYSTSGYRLGLLTHFYFNSDAAHSEWSLFAYGRYLDAEYEDADPEGLRTVFDRDNYTLSKFAVGLGGSYKHIGDDRMVLSVGAGLGRNFARKLVRQEGNTGDFLSLGFQPPVNLDVYVRVTVGYRIGGSN